MTTFALLLALLAPAAATPARTNSNLFATISLYQGNWRTSSAKPGQPPDILHNHCHDFGSFYACQQTVNGKVGALIVFIPAGKPGQFHNQAVLPNGYATGRGDLLIEGNRWTYSNKDIENGKTTYYRTTNLFTGRDHIHFEISHSADGKTWTVDRQGDEQRLASK